MTHFELYDVTTDVSESRNVIGADPQLSQRLQEQMERLYRELASSSHYWQREKKSR